MSISCVLFQFLAERGLVAFLETFERKRVVLRALVLDLDRAHEARDAARRLPVEVVEQAVQQASAVRVAATGWVLHGLGGNSRDFMGLLLRVDHGALPAERD